MYKLRKKHFFGILFLVVILAAVSASFLLKAPIISKTSPDSSEENAQTLKALIATENIKNKNILEGFANPSNPQFSPALLKPEGESEIAGNDYYKVSQKDSILLETKASGAFPYQRYSIRIEKDLASVQELNAVWEGHSNRMVDLYAWDYVQQQWVMLPKKLGRNKDNLAVTGSIDIQNMVKDSTVQMMVGISQKNNILKGKIPSPDEYDFSFAWLSDTQYYSASYPGIYEKMTNYIVDKQKENKIVYAIHTGDLVDNSEEEYQWKNADHSMKILDKAGIPYGVLAGNHDVSQTDANYNNYYKFFGEKRFNKEKHFGGSPNNNRDHYDIISAGNQNYIILYLGWSVQQSSIDWATEILKKYPSYKAIVAIHGYMSMRGSYVEQGREIYEKIISKNNNIFMVLCGHYGGAVVNVKREGERVFYEMLANYQFNEEGGMGYLRLLNFDTKNGLLYVNTYSPYKEDYNFYDEAKEEFILPLTEETGDIVLSTDYLNID